MFEELVCSDCQFEIKITGHSPSCSRRETEEEYDDRMKNYNGNPILSRKIPRKI